jgi:PAS domain S-box-containing protein
VSHGSRDPATVVYVANQSRSRAAGDRALSRLTGSTVQPVAGAEAAAEAADEGVDCVVVEQDDDPPATDALAVLSAVREVDPAVPVVVFERASGESMAAAAIDHDVTEYVQENETSSGDGAGSETPDAEALAAVARTADRAVDAYRAEQDVAMVNDLARTVYERITDGFFALDDDWAFTYLNAAAEDILEVDAEDVLGENVWEAFPEATEYAFYPEYHRAMETQEPVTFREHFPPLDKTFEVRAFPSPDGLSVHFRTVVEGESVDSRAGVEEPLPELAAVLSTDLSASLDRLRADLAAVEEHCENGSEAADAVESAKASVDRMADLVARAEGLAAEHRADRPSE